MPNYNKKGHMVFKNTKDVKFHGWIEIGNRLWFKFYSEQLGFFMTESYEFNEGGH